MNIPTDNAGAVLFFSHEELRPVLHAPVQRRREEALHLVRTALVKASQPIPPCMEIKVFHSREGALFFVLPKIPSSCPEIGQIC